MSNIRLSRGHLRCLAATERGGKTVVFLMTVLPIFVNFIWTIIYFSERTADVYSFGPCNLSNGTRSKIYATPFFVTNRGEVLWATQAVFTMLTVFVWAPYRYLRPRVTRQLFRLISVILVDCVTLLPFLISMVFPPAFIAYVPTFLRVWIVKYEVLSLLSQKQKIPYLIAYLCMDILSITITVIGAFEWSVNNFPVDMINYGTPVSSPTPIYPCMTFFDSLYWFMVTFATVGYGDIVPTNVVARMFVVFFIVLFLLLLPEFVGKVTTILQSSTDFKAAKFTRSKMNDYLVLDGRVTPRSALQALTVLQPKFVAGECTVGYIVLLTDAQDFEELVELRDAREEEYTRLFLMKGSLDVSSDADRAKAASSKAVYVLPLTMAKVEYPVISRKGPLRLREATELTREYCMRRDFDTIRRVWATQLSVRKAPIRTLLMHKANANLIDYSPLNRYSPVCRCNTVNFLFADSLEQRIGAISSLIPAYGTLLVNMVLGGSCSYKSFDEYEAEATNLAAIDKMYDDVKSHASHSPDHGPFAAKPSAEGLMRQPSTRVIHATPDDEQYVRSLRHGLLLVTFKGTQSATLSQICKMAFHARVLIFAFVPRSKLCNHNNVKPDNIEWSHQASVKPDDYLICYGGSHQIDIIRRPPFWQLIEPTETNAVPAPLGLKEQTANRETGSHSPNSGKLVAATLSTTSDKVTETARHRNLLLREGDFEHLRSDKFLKRDEARQMRDAYLRDTRAASEVESDSSDGSGSSSGESEGKEHLRKSGPESEAPPSSFREQLVGHVIVHSASHDNYVYFVRKLRARDLIESSRPILLLDSKPPNRFRWSEIGHFENVYYMQGRPFIIDDLRRAGFEHASCLVLLTDYRASFEYVEGDSPALVVDRDNLLAEKVANRLRKELECSTRIITHVAREESCEYVGVERVRRVVFNPTFRAKESLADISRRKAFTELARIFQQAWHPVTFSSYITGESWSPAAYLLIFLANETKGAWIASFLENMTDTAGSLRGLAFETVPDDCMTYEDAVLRFLDTDRGLVIGIFRGFTSAESSRFRGVLMFPQNDFAICNTDMLYVIRGQSSNAV